MRYYLFTLLFFSTQIFAQDLFTLKKNHNPKNVLHFTANVKDCRFGSPAVSTYWHMGEEEGQKEGLTDREKKYFDPKIHSESRDMVTFSMGAMGESDAEVSEVVTVRIVDCAPKAYVNVKGEEIELNSINVKLGFLMKVKKMEILGIDNQEKVSYRLRG